MTLTNDLTSQNNITASISTFVQDNETSLWLTADSITSRASHIFNESATFNDEIVLKETSANMLGGQSGSLGTMIGRNWINVIWIGAGDVHINSAGAGTTGQRITIVNTSSSYALWLDSGAFRSAGGGNYKVNKEGAVDILYTGSVWQVISRIHST